MTLDQDRRQELRVALPLQLRFNVLTSADEFVRVNPAALKGLKDMEICPDLEARDDLERFLRRLDNKMNVIISLLTDNLYRKNYLHRGEIVDISESGLRFLASLNLSPSAFLEIGLNMPSQPFRTMDIAGEIVWRQDYSEETKHGRSNLYGLKFSDITPADQDEIVHYLFQRQREDIRRGKNQT